LGHFKKEVVQLQTVKRPRRTRFEVADLRRRMKDARGVEQRDQVIYEVVQLFRRRPDTEVWELLLKELGQALTARVNRFRSPSALYQRDDFAQEMAIALHETALTIPLPSADRLERRLVLRTANRVSRLLKREWAKQELQDPLEVLDPDEEEETDES
jgi:hypothetical protein